jgi:hypothetical protein
LQPNYLIKVNNFDENAKDTLDEWIYFLKTSEIKDSFRAKGLEQAKKRMRIDNLDKAEQEEYDHYLKHERIRDSEIENRQFRRLPESTKRVLPVIEEERKQKEKTTQKLLRKMKKYGESVEEIMKETGLSRVEIERIK